MNELLPSVKMARNVVIKRQRSVSDSAALPCSSKAPPSVQRSNSQSSITPRKHTPFIEKTYRMLESKDTDDLISWLPCGTGFVVSNADKLASKVLPMFFNHGNFASFVRQLHFYGFHKTSLPTGACEFRHDNFLRGRHDLLHLISRKSTDTITKQRTQIDELQKHVAFLRQQNERLMHEQQRMMEMMKQQGPFRGDAAIADPAPFEDPNSQLRSDNQPTPNHSAFVPGFDWNSMPMSQMPSPGRRGPPPMVQIPPPQQQQQQQQRQQQQQQQQQQQFKQFNNLMMHQMALSPQVFHTAIPAGGPAAFSPLPTDSSGVQRSNLMQMDWGMAMQMQQHHSKQGGTRA